MSWVQHAPSLLTVALASEIERRHALPLAKPGEGQPKYALCVVDDMHLGSLSIDLPTRIVLSGWANAIERNKPTVDEATADGELDFWESYDAAKDLFVTNILNRVLPITPTIAGRLPENTLDVAYSAILRNAIFSAAQTNETPDVIAARELMFVTDETGFLTDSPAYKRYNQLMDAYLDAEDALEMAADNISASRRNRLTRTRDRAETSLNVQGRRAEIERAEQLLNRFSILNNAETYRSALQEKYDAAQLDSIAEPGRVYPSTTITNPGLLTQDVQETGWQHIELLVPQVANILNTETAEKLGFDIAGLRSALPNLHAIKAAYRIVDINRNWLDFSLFSKDNWHLTDIVSDGQGGGLLPAIADGLIVMPYFEVTELVCDVENKAPAVSTGRRNDAVIRPKVLSRDIRQVQKLMIKEQRLDAGQLNKMQKFKNLAAKRGLKTKPTKLIRQTKVQDLKALKAIHKQPERLLQKIKVQELKVAPKAQLQMRAFDKTKIRKAPAQAQRGKQARGFKGKLAQIREAQRKRKSAEILKVKDLKSIIAQSGEVQVLDAGFKMRPRPHSKPNSGPKITGQTTIVIHEDANLSSVEIFVVRLKNGQPAGPRKVIKSVNDVRGAFEFELTLPNGDYQLCVHYCGELVYGESFNLRAGNTLPQFNLEITVAEETVLGLNAEGSEEDAYLVPIFGYRMRHVPACPTGQNTLNHV